VAGEYLSKGRQVLIEGRLQLDEWDDRETGKRRTKLKVVGETMTMLGSRRDHDGGGGGGGGGGGEPFTAATTTTSDAPPTQPADEDVPF